MACVVKPDLDPADVKNYRPISNLNVLSKLLEKLVAGQLIDYQSDNKLLPESTFRAFRYLDQRQQNVCHRGELSVSASSAVQFGMRRGSVLGPILFMLYTTDRTDVVNSHRASWSVGAPVC